jgi:hypothetical protein
LKPKKTALVICALAIGSLINDAVKIVENEDFDSERKFPFAIMDKASYKDG